MGVLCKLGLHKWKDGEQWGARALRRRAQVTPQQHPFHPALDQLHQLQLQLGRRLFLELRDGLLGCRAARCPR